MQTNQKHVAYDHAVFLFQNGFIGVELERVVPIIGIRQMFNFWGLCKCAAECRFFNFLASFPVVDGVSTIVQISKQDVDGARQAHFLVKNHPLGTMRF